MTDGTRTLGFRITGRVQGVWFRGWTQATARDLGLTGWVRNDPDGAVSGVISGPPGAVEEMVAALHRGPELARVATVETETAAEERFQDFGIRR